MHLIMSGVQSEQCDALLDVVVKTEELIADQNAFVGSLERTE